MATAKRRPWNQMDHDSELLREEIVYATRTELRGPIPEFLAKKRAEQAPGTAAGYEVAFGVFERFCNECGVQTVRQIVEGVAHDFITAERKRGMSPPHHSRSRAQAQDVDAGCENGAGRSVTAGKTFRRRGRIWPSST